MGTLPIFGTSVIERTPNKICGKSHNKSCHDGVIQTPSPASETSNVYLAPLTEMQKTKSFSWLKLCFREVLKFAESSFSITTMGCVLP